MTAEVKNSLFRAIYIGDIKSVRKALSSGADPNCEDPISGLKAIHFAACQSNLEIVKELLATGKVLANSIDRQGRVPYELAHDYNKFDIENYIMEFILSNPKIYGKEATLEVYHHRKTRFVVA
ncbi:MAG: ankyrin repeat domain-containing protein [Bdellovibrionales bacterium]|nr:ankyrin repeat domain-containing protein [Bdellovibrionales bacterium]